MTLLFAFLVALFLTSALVPPFMLAARRLGLVDRPDARKVHKEPVPLCGGLAVAVGSLVPVLMWGPLGSGLGLALAATAIILVVGAIDDARMLHYGWRLLAQGVAVALILIGGVRFDTLPLFGLDAAPFFIAGPATALYILGCTNAVNLADGLDGLAGGLIIPTLLAIALLAYQGDSGKVVVVCAALTGAVLGFLRFNTHPASVFLGDAGSTFLGFSAAVLAIIVVQKCDPALNPAIVLLLAGVPVLDTLYAVLRRFAAGSSLFLPDKRHLHHQLLALGLSQVGAVGALYLLQGVMVLTAVLLRYGSDTEVLGAFVLIAVVAIVPLAKASAAPSTGQSAATLSPSAADARAAATDGPVAERRNLWLRRFAWLPGTALSSVKFGAAGFMLAGAVAPRRIGVDLAVVAACTVIVWLCLLIVTPRPSVLLRRLLIYAAAGFAAYLVVTAVVTVDRKFLSWGVALYLTMLTAALILAIRVTRRDLFRVTTQDLLVLFLAIFISNLVGEAAAQSAIREIIAVLIVLFYSTEYVLAKDARPLVGLEQFALLTFVLIGTRGLLF